MANQFDEIDTDAMDDGADGGAMRWVSVLVVAVAVAGFFALAWYAYHAGMEQAHNENVDVIHADGAPIKEAPADPGGQQFPHQDKTVYSLVSGKQEPKAAERILPAPEEPAQRPETETWMNKKLYPNQETPEEVKPAEEEKKEPEAVSDDKPTPPAENFKPGATKVQEKKAEVVKPIKLLAPKPEASPVGKTELKTAAVKPVESIKPVSKTRKNEIRSNAVIPPPVKVVQKPAAKGSARVQLGAYKSEKEALAQWNNIRARNGQIIADKQPEVVRADLGAKGIYYRLRVANFTNAKEARSFCGALAERHQACMPVTGK